MWLAVPTPPIQPIGGSPINTILLATIAAGSAFLSPIIMAWLTNRNARRNKQDDYNRQDLLADRVEKRQEEIAAKAELAAKQAASRTEEVAAQAAEAASLLVVANRAALQIAGVQTAKLDQIHTLVNSNLTASMQDQLDSQKAYLQLLIKMTEMRESQGMSIDAESGGLIQAARIKVSELEAQLRDRLQSTELAMAQLGQDLKR